MVWSLSPVEPLPGENQYYIFSKGTYKVGRKGCEIISKIDKSVSRIHAEVIVDEMFCMDHLQKKSSNSSKVRVRDCSKYGTFIEKNAGSKEKVHEFPNKETMLEDGDLVTFGTGNASYRFCFVSFMIFACSSKPSEMNQLQEKIALFGAEVARTWTSQCTHVVVNDFIPISNEIIDAILAKKPIVRFSWIELIAGKTICTETPSYILHTPTLILEGVSIKVADPQSRAHCLQGYTFLLESINKYKFKEKFQLLLEVGGAKVVYAENLDPCSQSLGDCLVCAMPTGMAEGFHNFKSLPKVKEIELVSAVASGHLDPSIMASAPVLITSSCSTDETVVADSDIEMETATSTHTFVAINLTDSAKDECEETIAIDKIESIKTDHKAENVVHIIESDEQDSKGNSDQIKTFKHESQRFVLPNHAVPKPDCSSSTPVKPDNVNITLSRDAKDNIMLQKNCCDAYESQNLDIIYSQDLIVRESNLQQAHHSSISGGGINFKRFRKASAPSGNSFTNLIPFSKYPYEESDYGSEDVAESIKEEKKRKQMEAIADDLFNNEKGRKRGAAGPLRGLFARG